MTDIQLSYFDKLHSTKPGNNLPIQDISNSIRAGQINGYVYAPVIAAIRQLGDDSHQAATEGKTTEAKTIDEQRKQEKKKLPAVTFSGTFAQRNESGVLQYSGLLCLDYDNVEALNETKNRLVADKYTYICFISPSGTGLKLVVKTGADKSAHKDYFKALDDYYREKYNIEADPSGKDIARLCFLSHDPEIYVNHQPATFLLPMMPPAVQPVTPGRAGTIQPKPAVLANGNNTLDQVEHCILQIEERQLDITDGYDNWLNIALALANEFGENGRGFFHRASMYNPDYAAAECDKKFSNAVQTNNGKITIRSFFDACKKAGIEISPRKHPEKHSKNTQKNAEKTPKITPQKQENNVKKSEKTALAKDFTKNRGDVAQTNTDSNAEKISDIFNIYRRNSAGEVTEINIIQFKFYEMLKQLGYRRYDMDINSSIFVEVTDNIIEQVSHVKIQDRFFDMLKQLPEAIIKKSEEVRKSTIVEKFTKGSDTYFNPKKLNHLRNDRPFNMCADTRDCSYIFFNNGFVECKADGYKLLPYTEMSGYIWKGQKIDKNFNALTITGKPPVGMFTSFLQNVCNHDENRLHSLCTIVGYMLHSYYDYKLKAIVLTDSEISDTPNGRTGKSLLLQALKKVKPAAIINGKNFKTDHQFKYQDVNPDTSIVALNDVKRHFNVEDLFNDISDGITVEKKNQKPFSTQAKMIIATNMTLKIEGASANDRFIEFEFSNHYSDTRSPKDDFGKWFFSEWDDTEWNDFYNLMAYCICQFLKNALVVPESINIERRRLIEHTNDDFITWMDEQVSAGQIVPGNEYPKNELYARFIEAYPDYGEKGKGQITQRAFTSFLKRYINKSGNFAPFKKEDTRRSNGKDMILFRSVTDASGYTDQQAKKEAEKLPF